jgi:hypothetical protein
VHEHGRKVHHEPDEQTQQEAASAVPATVDSSLKTSARDAAPTWPREAEGCGWAGKGGGSAARKNQAAKFIATEMRVPAPL